MLRIQTKLMLSGAALVEVLNGGDPAPLESQ
jgi:hypothetical protein